MIPVVDNTHVAEGVALLTSRYVNQHNVRGFVTALCLKFQEKEADLRSLLTGVVLANHPMAGGPWSILDQIGALVGEARAGRSDADYVPAIKIRILVNRSNGLAEDIIGIVAAVVAGASYYEWPPGAFEVDVFNTTSPIVGALVAYLGQARSTGTAGTLRYSTDAGPFVRWASHYGGVTGAGFASHYGGAPLDELSAMAAY